MEATEDFIAIGKDVNMVDADQRTPLHYAVAYAQHEVFDELVKAGAKLNVVVRPNKAQQLCKCVASCAVLLHIFCNGIHACPQAPEPPSLRSGGLHTTLKQL